MTEESKTIRTPQDRRHVPNELWAQFCAEKNIDPSTPYQAWAFGGDTAISDELADLVLAGRKFGTASAYDCYAYENALDEIPKVGDYSIILNSKGEALCVIRDYEVYIRPFGDVPPFHAYSEGEGDRSLTYWRQVHTDFFNEEYTEMGGGFTEEAPIVCEKFSLEYVPGKGAEEDELIFAEPSETYAAEIAAYRQEMLDAGSDFDGCFCMKRMENPSDFIYHCTQWSNPRGPEMAGGTKGNVILAIRKSDGKMIGCFQAHNVLNETMANITGHLGYSVRPSERRKGYATRIMARAKDFLSSFGFTEIIVSCLPDNEGSRKTILANGGEYLETVYLERDNVYLERYRVIL